MKKNNFFEKGILLVLAGATLCVSIVLIALLTTVFGKGFSALSFHFLTREAQNFGSEGGILYQILGTLWLMAVSVAMGLPVAFGAALYQIEYLQSTFWKRGFCLLIYSLNSVPTIIFGLIGYAFFGVYLELGVSWLTGALTLAVMILPTMQVSIQEAMKAVPLTYRDSGLALGLTPLQCIWSIVIPQSFYGIVTGTLLGLARAAGETAAIMFTATVFSGVRFPESLFEPVTTLQTHILILAQEAVNPKSLSNAWGAGLVLLALVFILISISFWIRTRLLMEAEA